MGIYIELWPRYDKMIAKILNKFRKKLSCSIPDKFSHVRLPHPVGIVISKRAKIGANVTIYQNTTIGGYSIKTDKFPVIEDNAIIYANCLIAGNVIIKKGERVPGGTVRIEG